MNTNQFLAAPETIGEIEEFAMRIVEDITEGREYALDIFVATKRWQRTIEVILKNIEEYVVRDAEREGKRFTHKGVHLEMRELGTRWFYDKCNDPVITSIMAEKEVISNKEKERQAFLKTLKGKTALLDEETGEVYNVIPPRKESKTGVVATIS
jgi:hypothetical protein